MASFPEGETEEEANPSHVSNVDVKNEWKFTSTSLICLHGIPIKYRGIFNFKLSR
jgi:hypothetical protein